MGGGDWAVMGVGVGVGWGARVWGGAFATQDHNHVPANAPPLAPRLSSLAGASHEPGPAPFPSLAPPPSAAASARRPLLTRASLPFPPAFYPSLLCPCRCVPMNQVRGIFGFTMDDHIGKIAFPAVQVRCCRGTAMVPLHLVWGLKPAVQVSQRAGRRPGSAWQRQRSAGGPADALLKRPPLPPVFISMLVRTHANASRQPCCPLPSTGRPRLPRHLPPHVWRTQGREVCDRTAARG